MSLHSRPLVALGILLLAPSGTALAQCSTQINFTNAGDTDIVITNFDDFGQSTSIQIWGTPFRRTLKSGGWLPVGQGVTDGSVNGNYYFLLEQGMSDSDFFTDFDIQCSIPRKFRLEYTCLSGDQAGTAFDQDTDWVFEGTEGVRIDVGLSCRDSSPVDPPEDTREDPEDTRSDDTSPEEPEELDPRAAEMPDLPEDDDTKPADADDPDGTYEDFPDDKPDCPVDGDGDGPTTFTVDEYVVCPPANELRLSSYSTGGTNAAWLFSLDYLDGGEQSAAGELGFLGASIDPVSGFMTCDYGYQMLVETDWSCPYNDFSRELGAQAIVMSLTMPAAGACVAYDGFNGNQCLPNDATGGICDSYAYNGDCLDFRDGPEDCMAICPFEATFQQ